MNYANFAIWAPVTAGVIAGCHSLWLSKRWKDASWDPKEAKSKFSSIVKASSKEELAKHAGCLQAHNLVPVIHQGKLGVASKKEAMALTEKYIQCISLAVSGLVATYPILKFFGKCGASSSLKDCFWRALRDLLDFSGLPLFAGACLVHLMCVRFIMKPATVHLYRDFPYGARLKVLKEQYKTMADLVEKESQSEDVKVREEMKQAAEQFLNHSDMIQKILHEELAIDVADTEQIILPLKTICLQISLNTDSKKMH